MILNVKKCMEVKLQNIVTGPTENGSGLQIKSAQTMKQGYIRAQALFIKKGGKPERRMNIPVRRHTQRTDRRRVHDITELIPRTLRGGTSMCCCVVAAALERDFCTRRALRLITFLIGTCGSTVSWKRSGNECALDSHTRSRRDLNEMIREKEKG